MADQVTETGPAGQSVINVHLMVQDESNRWVPLKSSEGGLSTNPTAGSAITSVVGRDGVDAAVSGQVLTVELTDMAESRIKGRAESAGSGAPTDLTPSQVIAIINQEDVTWTGMHSWNEELNLLQIAAPINSPAPGYGQLYIDTDNELHIYSNSSDRTILSQSSAASRLIGRGSASGAGQLEEISLGSGLSMSTTTLAVALANNYVTDAMLRQSTACTLIGRSANSTGNVADISISEGQVPVRRSNAIASGYANRMVYRTSDLTVDASHAGSVIGCNTSGGAIIITLPTITAALDTMVITVKKLASANTVTINRGGSDVIGSAGTTSNVLNAIGSFVTLMADDALDIWWVVDANDYLETTDASSNSFPTTGQYGGDESISIPPGEWELTWRGIAIQNGATITSWGAFIGTASGNNTTGLVSGSNSGEFFPPNATQTASGWCIANYRISLSSTTTYYGKVYANYSVATPQYRFAFVARRVA